MSVFYHIINLYKKRILSRNFYNYYHAYLKFFLPRGYISHNQLAYSNATLRVNKD